MALKVYTSGNYIITDTGSVMHEFAKGYTTYSYNQSTQTFTIRESVGGSFTVTRTQLLAGDIIDEAESAYTFNSFVTFLRENTGFKTAPGGSGASYKVYTALLNQSGTNPPVATVLENNLGANITYNRTTNGRYDVNCDAAIFDELKTVLILGNSSNTLFNLCSLTYNGGNNQLFIATSDGGSIAMDDILYNTLIEIRVYN